MTIVRGLAYVYTSAYPVSGIPDSFNIIGEGDIMFLPIPLWITIFVLTFGMLLLKKTISGNHIYAIGNNKESARLAGINIDRTIIKVYVLSGIMCAIAAIILTARLNSGQPTSGKEAEMDAISASVLGGISLSGGVGSITGAFLGALIIGFINNGMNMLNVSAYYQLIVKGIVILLAIAISCFRYARNNK
jgi:ribose transport system permease protein